MALQCNIDSRGRAVRLVYGAVVLFGGVAMVLFWAIPTGSLWAWIIAVLAVMSGTFALFEARAGWCIVRAMGFKTPV